MRYKLWPKMTDFQNRMTDFRYFKDGFKIDKDGFSIVLGFIFCVDA